MPCNNIIFLIIYSLPSLFLKLNNSNRSLVNYQWEYEFISHIFILLIKNGKINKA